MKKSVTLCPICGEPVTVGINPDWYVCTSNTCHVASIYVTPDAITIESYSNSIDMVIPTGIFIPIKEQPL